MIEKRRIAILTAAIGILLVPLVPEAQLAGKAPAATQISPVPRIGVTLAPAAPSPYADALRRGLAELGWIEGKNILIDYRYAGGRSDRYPAFMAELVALKVNVIVAGGGVVAVRAAKQATSAIPIVMPAIIDPVATGLVASLPRPGGNVTGQSMLDIDITTKRMEFLKAVSPRLERIAVLNDPSQGDVPVQAGAMEAAARSLGLRLQFINVGRIDELDGALDAAKAARAEGLIVLASGLFTANRQRLVDIATRYRLAAVYEHRDFVDAGGLLSYGVNFEEMWHSAAKYVDRILKGAKPSDLPVEQPNTFELVINLRAAKMLQVTIPPTLLLRADRVLE